MMTRLDLAPADRVLITGGARSGKSVTAEQALTRFGGPVLYVAAGEPASAADPEWAARVRSHQDRRPEHWRTVETRDLAGVLTAAQDEPVLIDCLGTWLAGVLDEVGAWRAAPDHAAALARRVDELVQAWRSTPRTVVAVTNEVGSGVHPEHHSGRLFRDELGRLNARLAAEADQVWLCVAGVGLRIA